MPFLYVVEAGFSRTVPLTDAPCSIGRSEENIVFLKNHEASRKHAEVRKLDDGWVIIDLDSKNGVSVNGNPVKEQKLRHGDVIKIGLARIFFRETDSAGFPGATEPRQKIGEMMVEKGLVKAEQVKEALETQEGGKKRIGEILVEKGYVPEEQFLEVLGEQMQVPWINLQHYNIDPEALKLFTRANALQWKAIPVFYHREARKLVTAMADPTNLGVIQEIELLTYCNVEVMIASQKDILEAIERYYPADDAVLSAAKKVTEAATGAAQPIPSIVQEESEQEKGISKLVSLIIEEAVKNEASDIHVEPRDDRVAIRYRIDGVLRETKSLPRELQSPVVNRLKILAQLDIAEKRLPQDGRCKLTVLLRDIDFRVSTFPTIRGEKVVLRILDRSVARLDIEALGMEEGLRAAFVEMINRSEGIVIVTGPTGSGKTSTLYAAMNTIRSPELNMVTLEDPVEYEFPEINQAQVLDNPKFTFASGLRSILRQDPDIILVGEIRDKETLQIAIQAALTGHLVLTTLHTNSASGTIPRLIDMGAEPYLLTASILGILAQRLLRRICQHCKTVDHPPAELLRMAFPKVDTSGMTFYRGAGCDKCQGGYRGRIGAFEFLPVTDAIRQMIMSQASAVALKAKAIEEGMVTLRDDALAKAVRGVTTLDEVMRVTYAEF